jgi:hypothetical protein
MKVSSIGIQSVQPSTATPQQMPSADMGDDRIYDRVTPSAPIQSPPPPGTGAVVDKTV